MKDLNASKERDILRRLAAEVAALAQLPVQNERRKLWAAMNDLHPERPMLWINEIPWGEFEDHVDELRTVCTNEQLRVLEKELRRKIFVATHLKTDEVVEGVYRLNISLENFMYGVETDEVQIEQGAASIQSHHYKPVIAEMEDIEKIKIPAVYHNVNETMRRMTFCDALFGDILPVVVTGVRCHFFTAWDDLVRWTGVTEALIDLHERPEYIHALMRRVTDSYLARMKQFEEQNLLSPSGTLLRVASGAAGFTNELPRSDSLPGKVFLADQWGGATAQIFVDVSPEMHAEFALQYEKEIMSLCGLNYYGCCEPVHNKMHLLATVPNLRKISISPWCDVKLASEQAGTRYVFSHKPSPAIFAESGFSAERARMDIRRRLENSGEHACEFIMKDISTIRNDVQRMIDWCSLAYDECLQWAN